MNWKTFRDALTKAEDSYIAFHIANVKQATFDVSVELFNRSKSKYFFNLYFFLYFIINIFTE